MSKKIIFLIDCVSGGGAERVVTVLANAFSDDGCDVTVVVTRQSLKDIVGYGFSDKVKVLSLADTAQKKDFGYFLKHKLCRIASLKGTEASKKKLVVSKFAYRNSRQLRALRSIFKEDETSTVIAFLNYSIQLALIAAEKTKNRIVISERADPGQYDAKIYAFTDTVYRRADAMVFQSPSAMACYPEHIGKIGVVIFNPVKSGLPERFTGKRNNTIVNFCRISKEKNIPLLLSAFLSLHTVHPELSLDIIGDAFGDEGQFIIDDAHKFIDEHGLSDSVRILPFNAELHKDIVNCAMFVSSSDYEGMSNSMLEAMAIGLPTVCTDCPAGGARAVIRDHENGILTPVGDAAALYAAMKEVIENKSLAEKLSVNGSKIRKQLSLNTIIKKWTALI